MMRHERGMSLSDRHSSIQLCRTCLHRFKGCAIHFLVSILSTAILIIGV